MTRPIGIDLFAGAGGLSLGFEQAGFDVRAAVEIDPVHCAVHKFNFPECAVIPRSIRGLSGAEIRRAAGIADARVDVVFGGPPCQGFSLIGHRSLDDERNSLVLDFVRIVRELDARAFVFENVKGLTVGQHKKFLGEIFGAFRAAGYLVREQWRVLDAAEYGVPQRRQRLFLLGAKKGEMLAEYPDAITVPVDDWRRKGIKGPSCKDALGDLPDADEIDLLEIADAAPARLGRPSAYAREMRCLSNDAWHYGYVRDWDATKITSSMRTEHTKISARRFADTPEGTVEPISRFFRLSASGLSNTLRAGTDGARGAFTSPRPIHYKHPRCITVREMARLHGFPDWFRLHSTKWHGARQVGNSVPPPLARAVAFQVIKALGCHSAKPNRTIALGSASLLSATLSDAASHFGVEKPKSRRDRKSGAKKRKQHETEAARIAALESARA